MRKAPKFPYTSNISSIFLSKNSKAIDFTGVYAWRATNTGANPCTIKVGTDFTYSIPAGGGFGIPYMKAPFPARTEFVVEMDNAGATTVQLYYIYLNPTDDTKNE